MMVLENKAKFANGTWKSCYETWMIEQSVDLLGRPAPPDWLDTNVGPNCSLTNLRILMNKTT